MSAATVLRATRVFDGERLLDGPHEVHIEGGRITAIVPSRGPGENASTDFGDATILPGLVDAHVHLSFDVSPDLGALARSDTPATAALGDERPQAPGGRGHRRSRPRLAE